MWLLIFLICILVLSACGKNDDYSKVLAGSWYHEGSSTPAFILYDDGTCEIDGEYGKGTWEIDKNKQLVLYNYYGESEIAPIFSIKDNCLTLGTESDRIQFWNSPHTQELDNGEIVVENSEEQMQEVNERMEVTYYGNAYHDGIAWVNYTNRYLDENDNFLYSENYETAIDKDGNALFRINTENISDYTITNFSNGYAHVLTDNRIYVINKDGEITSSYDRGTDIQVLAYGDGYTLIEEHISNFDSSEYQYKVFDYSGNVKVSFEYPEKAVARARYCEKGIFQMYITNRDAYYGTKYTDYVSATTGKSIELHADVSSTFFEDTTVAGFSSHDPDEVGYRGLLHLINVDFQETSIPIYPDTGWDWESSCNPAVADGVCVIQELYDGILYIYDVENAEFRKFDGENADKLMLGVIKNLENPLIFQNNRLALPLRGNDGKSYVAVYDKQWNQVTAPIQTNHFFPISCDRVLIQTESDTVIYDVNGNEIFKMSDLGYQNEEIQPFSDNVAKIDSSSDELIYVDTNGNILFDKMKLDNVKEIVIE